MEKAQVALTPLSLPPLAEVDEKRKMDSLAKSRYPSLVGKRATQGMLLMPSDSGLGASRTTEITTMTHI